MAKVGLHFDDGSFRKLMTALDELDPRSASGRKMIGEALEATGRSVEADAKRRSPVDTGRLRGSITTVPRAWNRVAIGTNVRYAKAVEYGSAPHIIRPKNKKALRFTVGRREIFAKRVNHPGTRPQPFLRPAMRDHFPSTFRRIYSRSVKQRLKGVV